MILTLVTEERLLISGKSRPDLYGVDIDDGEVPNVNTGVLLDVDEQAPALPVKLRGDPV